MSARWFTDPAAAGPVSIHPGLTSFEQSHFAAILEFACNSANLDWENLRCLDSAGMHMHDMSVGVKAAPITDKMKSLINSGTELRLWHNHPSQASLSHYDWQAVECSAELEILALNNIGSIFVGRILDTDYRLNLLLKWLPRLASDLELHMELEARKRKNITPQDRLNLSRFTAHVLNSALAEHGRVRYAYHLMPGDQAVIDLFSRIQIIQDSLRFASDAIDQKLADISAAQIKLSGNDPSTPDTI